MPIYMRMMKNGAPVIQGDSTARGREGWIELESVQFSTSRALGSDKEKTAHTSSEIVISKQTDSASDKLFLQSLNGEVLTVQIDFMKDGKSPYLTFKLQNTLISGFSLAGGKSNAQETITLNFTKITFDTHGTGPDITGHAEAATKGWNANSASH